jgi:hypothetical protein
MKDRIFFKLKMNIPDLDKYFSNASPCSENYKAELIHDKDDIQIKIFYPYDQQLPHKIWGWNKARSGNLLDQFETIEVNQPVNLIDISFKGHNYRGITTSSNFTEFELKYFVIKVSGVRKTYKNRTGESTEFYLNKHGFLPVEINYDYKLHLPWVNAPYTWEPTNKIQEYIKFDKIEFKSEHDFYNTNDNSSNTVSIQKDPKITVKHGELLEPEVKQHMSLLFALYSFYSHKNVDFISSKIQTTDNYFFELKDSKEAPDDGHGIFRWEFNQNPLNLITNVDAPKLIQNLEFVKRIIARYNYALEASSESRFMMLYNILEQIRNQYILEGKIDQDKAGEIPNPKKVIELYNFTESNTKTDKIIKETLEKLVDIIADEHKEIFLSEISQKVSCIKQLSMANQFKSLFDYLAINPAEHGLDFDKIKSIRNDIFHGAPVVKHSDYLEKISNYELFPKFAGVIILKYFGIGNLSAIKNDWSD